MRGYVGVTDDEWYRFLADCPEISGIFCSRIAWRIISIEDSVCCRPFMQAEWLAMLLGKHSGPALGVAVCRGSLETSAGPPTCYSDVICAAM